ncbi:hypothetical protein PGT21_000836 [Puccinia graminis f. sp. tritici]|uniref:Uncharacterized protein n=1 Tax=Puccinia graminis f. sp. tritici TaxID=56615 RepID=A0A5B0LIE8_PUCGR|nr:hypothetical protein PGT21_000836 [Puccinia graminis f. sp. tritici]
MRFYTVGFCWIYLLSSPVLLLTTLLPEIQDSGKLVHQPHLQFDLNRVPVDDCSKEILPWSFQPSSSLAASSPDFTSHKDQAALRSPANIQKPIPSKDDIKSSRHKRKNELSSKPDGKRCRSARARQQPLLVHTPHVKIETSVKRTPLKSKKNLGNIKGKGLQSTTKTENSTESANFDSFTESGTNQERCGLLDIHSSNFLRLNPEKKATNAYPTAHQDIKLHQILTILNNCKKKIHRDEFFWIPRCDALRILHKYQRSDRSIPFPKEIIENHRKKGLLEVSICLSNKHIGLDGHSVFTKDILGRLTSKLELKLKRFPKPTFEIQRRFRSAIQCIQDLTKSATFLVIVYLALFQELKENKITSGEVEEILNVFGKLWTDIEEGGPNLTQHVSWKNKVEEVLSLESHSHLFNQRSKDVYQMSWNFVEYYIELKGKKLEEGSKDPKFYRATLHALINKILFYNNYDYFSKFIIKGGFKEDHTEK